MALPEDKSPDMLQGIINQYITQSGGNPGNLPRSTQGQTQNGALDQVAKWNKEYDRLTGEYEGPTGAKAKSDSGLAELLTGLKDYTPDPSAKWLAFAQTIAQPTKFGTLGEVVSNVASGLAPIVAKENQLKDQYKMMAMQMGYQVQQRTTEQLQSNRMALLKEMPSMVKAERASTSTGKFVPTGTPGIMMNNVTKETVDMRDQRVLADLREYVTKNAHLYDNDEQAFQAGMSMVGKIQNMAGKRAPGPGTGALPSPVDQTTPEVRDPIQSGTSQPNDRTVSAPPFNVEVPKAAATPEMDKAMLAANAANDKVALPQQPRVMPPAPTYDPTTPRKDIGKDETLKKQADALVEYEKGLTSKNEASNAMMRHVAKLREESKSANFGAGAGAITEALKWADRLGVTLSPEDRAAMNANQVIGKIALQLATIGAKDITSRPTQMEFQKLLEEGVPSTGMTIEAFRKVLNMFHEGAVKEQGQLQEFGRWKEVMPSKAKSPGDFSTYWSIKQNSPDPDQVTPEKVVRIMQRRGISWHEALNLITKVK